MQDLKQRLLSGKYPERIIDTAIDRANKIPRHIALRKTKTKTKSKRPVFALRYDPRLQAIENIQAKHWRSMNNQDCYLAEVFEEPPLTGYKRQKNLREYLIRAKIPNSNHQRPHRKIKGMAKCNKPCKACPYRKEGRNIRYNKSTWKINRRLNCGS